MCRLLRDGSCCVQFLLGALLFFVVPKNRVPGFKRSLTPDTFSQAAVEMDTIPAGVGSEVFCIVFDAGSTGAMHPVSPNMMQSAQINSSSSLQPSGRTQPQPILHACIGCAAM